MLPTVLFLVVMTIMTIITLIFIEMQRILYPSKGNKIEDYPSPGRAFIIIDVQEDFTGPEARFPYNGSDRVINRINSVIEKSSDKNLHVIYIRHEVRSLIWKMFSKIFTGGAAIEGNPGAKIDSRIPIINDNEYTKDRPDAFDNPEFENFLIKNKISELYLSGLDASACVYATAIAAVNRGYKTHICTDAILMRSENRMESLLKKYEKKGVNLLTTSEI